jgi:hypothetical protein
MSLLVLHAFLVLSKFVVFPKFWRVESTRIKTNGYGAGLVYRVHDMYTVFVNKFCIETTLF